MVDVTAVKALIVDALPAVVEVGLAALMILLAVRSFGWVRSALGESRSSVRGVGDSGQSLEADFAAWEQSDEAVALRAEVGDDLSKIHWTDAQWRAYISEPETPSVSVNPGAKWEAALAAMSPAERAEYDLEEARINAETAADEAAIEAKYGVGRSHEGRIDIPKLGSGWGA